MNTKLTATIAIAVVAMMVFSTAGATTLSWFTDTEETDITITTGKLDVSTSEFYVKHAESELITKESAPRNIPIIYDDGRDALTKWANETLFVAGDPENVDVEIGYMVTFSGDLDYKYLVDVECPDDLGVEISAMNGNEVVNPGVWNEPAKFDDSFEFTLAVKVNISSIPMGLNDAIIKIVNEITQYLNPKVDTWDGSTVDTSWYNNTNTEFTLTSAEQLAGFADLVNNGDTFAGKTIKLGSDVDLYALGDNGEPITFGPIGDGTIFSGTFDGQGHTIKNIYQSGWALGYEWGTYGSLGLFSELENATVKDVIIEGAEQFVEGGDVSFIAGSATGTCVFENITIKDSTIATYNNGCGGIIGWSGAGNYTFKNITLEEDVVLGGLWGSFDSSIGGIVGQGEPGATYNFENVDINCRIDAYNDCTASYDYYNYRMCGMIIGRLEETTTIDGTNYPDTSKYNITCTNVTVTYGDWANYHYCEPTPGLNGGRGMRVEPGYAYDGLPADYDHSQCVDNHMNLIPFDQIFGGDQLGVKGLKTYDGVTVVYNNV